MMNWQLSNNGKKNHTSNLESN